MGGFSAGQSKESSKNQTSIDADQKKFLMDLWRGSQGFQRGGESNLDMAQSGNFINQLQSNPYGASFQNFMQPNNQMAQQQIGLLGQNLADQFNNQIMPGINSNAQMTGQFGGGRQGVAQGLAAQGISRAFAEGSSNIQNNAYNQALQATNMGANWNTQNAMAGLSGLGQQQQMQWSPYLNMAQVLGGPAMTGTGKSSGSSWNFEANVGA
jgi:hypothetical protein